MLRINTVIYYTVILFALVQVPSDPAHSAHPVTSHPVLVPVDYLYDTRTVLLVVFLYCPDTQHTCTGTSTGIGIQKVLSTANLYCSDTGMYAVAVQVCWWYIRYPVYTLIAILSTLGRDCLKPVSVWTQVLVLIRGAIRV